MSALSREAMPPVGERRFWEVTHNPKSISKPVTVTLRETIVSGKRLVGMSRILGHDTTVADPEQIIATAKLIEARVGRIDEVVGVY
jgi:hypothetical protein